MLSLCFCLIVLVTHDKFESNGIIFHLLGRYINLDMVWSFNFFFFVIVFLILFTFCMLELVLSLYSRWD